MDQGAADANARNAGHCISSSTASKTDDVPPAASLVDQDAPAKAQQTDDGDVSLTEPPLPKNPAEGSTANTSRVNLVQAGSGSSLSSSGDLSRQDSGKKALRGEELGTGYESDSEEPLSN